MYLESIHGCIVEDTKTEPFVIVKLAHIVTASPSHHLRIMNIFQNAHMMNTLCVHFFPRDGPYSQKKLCNDIFNTKNYEMPSWNKYKHGKGNVRICDN